MVEEPLGSLQPDPIVRVPARPAKELFPVEFHFSFCSPEDPTKASPCVLKFLSEGVDISNPTTISVRWSSGLRFLPQQVMELKVVYNGESYLVDWIGGTFDFVEIGVCGISFMRKPPQT